MKIRFIREYSDKLKTEFGINSDNVYIPVYYYADSYPDDWQYTYIHILNKNMTEQIEAFCVFDRYGNREDPEHEYYELLRGVYTHQDDWIPDSIMDVLEEN